MSYFYQTILSCFHWYTESKWSRWHLTHTQQY